MLVLLSRGSRDPSLRSLAWGLPLAILGLLLRAWATGHLEKNIRLAQSGPYAYVRNPLYLGTLLVGGRLRPELPAMAAGGLVRGRVRVHLSCRPSSLEEQHLRNLFPDFAAYAQRVPALWPTLRPLNAAGSFRWDLYLRNREYQAFFGFLAGTALLIAKVLVPRNR